MRASKSGRRGARFGAWGTFLVAVTIASTAAGQDDAERTALARSLFREGVELSDVGRWDDAADRFRRSLSLRDSPVVAFNLGTALTHTGHLLEASELFRRAARAADSPPPLAQAARAQLEEVQPRLGRLTVEVTGAAESASIELDGEPLPPAVIGVAAPADPGHHVLRAMRDDTEVARAEVDVTEGGAASARLDGPAPVVPAPDEVASLVVHREQPSPVEPPPPSGGDDVAIWIGVIAGIVVVGAAVAVTSYFILDGQGSGPAIGGNLTPAVITFE